MSKNRRVSSVRPPPDERPKNRLLAALPADDFHRLRPYLKTVPIHLKQMLHEKGERLRAVYFPNGGVVSITTRLVKGTMVEAATVGDEGMVGIEAFLSDHAVAPGDAFMQVPDTNAERMSIEDFRRETGAPGAFRDLIGRYTQVVIAQMMQSTACNALHEVPQRCARWLLTTHDRMHEQDFTLSLLENEEETLQHIEVALARIADGTYGTCEGCGAEILKTRLQAIPYAVRCVDCARKEEGGRV